MYRLNESRQNRILKYLLMLQSNKLQLPSLPVFADILHLFPNRFQYKKNTAEYDICHDAIDYSSLDGDIQTTINKYAKLSRDAYAIPSNGASKFSLFTQLGAYDYIFFLIPDIYTNLHIIIPSNESNPVYIIYSGSYSLNALLKDLVNTKTSWDMKRTQGKVNKYFFEIIQLLDVMIKWHISDKILSTRDIHLLGHSLGGVLAQFTAARLRERQKRNNLEQAANLKVWSYGGFPFCDQEFQNYYNKVLDLGTVTYNLANVQDLVPQLFDKHKDDCYQVGTKILLGCDSAPCQCSGHPNLIPGHVKYLDTLFTNFEILKTITEGLRQVFRHVLRSGWNKKRLTAYLQTYYTISFVYEREADHGKRYLSKSNCDCVSGCYNSTCFVDMQTCLNKPRIKYSRKWRRYYDACDISEKTQYDLAKRRALPVSRI